MPICHVAWVNGDGNHISQVFASEQFTFTTVAGTSGVCPLGANRAIVQVLEGDAYVAPMMSNTLVTQKTALFLQPKDHIVFIATPGVTKVSAIK